MKFIANNIIIQVLVLQKQGGEKFKLMQVHVLQVPITVHFDHGTSKQELLESLELVSWLVFILKPSYNFVCGVVIIDIPCVFKWY